MAKTPQWKDKHNLVLLNKMCDEVHLPHPVTEYMFAAPGNKWRFDYAWPSLRIALEVEGGLYMKHASGHRSVTGVLRDMTKYNRAAAMGWFVIRCQPETLLQWATINNVVDAANSRHLSEDDE